MPFNRDGTYLARLSEEDKRELCRKRLLNAWTHERLSDYLRDELGYEATSASVANFFRSSEGELLQGQEHAEIRKRYLDEPLIEKGTRVLALRKQARRLGAMLDELTVIDDEWFEASAEYRQYMKLIKDEIEGSKITLDGEVNSPAEWYKEAKVLDLANH